MGSQFVESWFVYIFPIVFSEPYRSAQVQDNLAREGQGEGENLLVDPGRDFLRVILVIEDG
ncbi:MAG: hypothetical protein RBG13Loki_0037 [Promethearchaeota archaeon CR_4]|nr:MAG: hypothetical protein RBG13Loki_0037 [Candidatus Lokiarchaeota archaeon CR_4]